MNNVLNSVSAISSTDVWAVGSALYSRVGSAGQSISNYYSTIMHWDGNAWSMVANSNPGTSGSQLFGVSRINANETWAAGGIFGNGTVIQRYIAP